MPQTKAPHIKPNNIIKEGSVTRKNHWDLLKYLPVIILVFGGIHDGRCVSEGCFHFRL